MRGAFKKDCHKWDLMFCPLFMACPQFGGFTVCRSSHSQMFFKVDVLKNFAIFTRKHLF